MSLLASYKAQFFRSSRIHLNNAGLSPIPSVTSDKIKYWAQRFYEEGYFSDHDYQQDVLGSRKSLAQLIGCDHSEIAFFQSTASGVSQIAFGFGLQAEDEVVIWDQEYSSNMYPWQAACQRAKAKLVMVPSLPDLVTPVEALMKFCTERTKIVAVSWVQYQTGARTDIEKLSIECHKKNIFLFVDVIQGLGLHTFDFKAWNIDALAGGSHKWLSSAVGVGFLALKKEHQAKFLPLIVGSGTYGSCDDPASLACAPKEDATRFEAGSKQVLEITALGASCDLILRTGILEIEKEAIQLAKKLRSGLEELNCNVHSPFSIENHATPIVNFSCSSIEKVKKIFNEKSVNFVMRGPGLRLSPHAFNTDEDIEIVLNLLKNNH